MGKYADYFAKRQRERMGILRTPAEEQRIQKFQQRCYNTLLLELDNCLDISIVVMGEKGLPTPHSRFFNHQDALVCQNYVEFILALNAALLKVSEKERLFQSIILPAKPLPHTEERFANKRLGFTGEEGLSDILSAIINALDTLHEKGAVLWRNIVTEDFDIELPLVGVEPHVVETVQHYVSELHRMRRAENGLHRREFLMVGFRPILDVTTGKPTVHLFKADATTLLQAVSELMQYSGHDPDDFSLDWYSPDENVKLQKMQGEEVDEMFFMEVKVGYPTGYTIDDKLENGHYTVTTRLESDGSLICTLKLLLIEKGVESTYCNELHFSAADVANCHWGISKESKRNSCYVW